MVGSGVPSSRETGLRPSACLERVKACGWLEVAGESWVAVVTFHVGARDMLGGGKAQRTGRVLAGKVGAYF